MARNEDIVLNKSAYSSSSNMVQYVCDCAKCKGTSWYAYGTVRRHRSNFGINAKKLVRRAGLWFSQALT